MHSPGPIHFEAMYRILRYLKGTPGKGILFQKMPIFKLKYIRMQIELELEVLLIEDLLLVIVCLLEDIQLHGLVKKQNVVAKNNAKAEFRADTWNLWNL